MKDESFEIIWKKGILAKGKNIVNDNIGKVEFDLKSKHRILNEYNKLRDFTKVSYMKNPDGLLDRHKVCACLIIAIVKVSPLKCIESENQYDFVQIYNENLAVSVGLSLLRNYIISANNDFVETFKNGFVFPPSHHEATYQDLLGLMLHYDIINKNYSILALANILFLIEEYTKLSYQQKNIQ